MRPHANQVPKSLLPVAGRPFAELQLEWLRAEGVEEVIYCIGYRGTMVRDALGDGRRFGLTLRYVDEGDSLRGTAGALRLALDTGELADAFFVLNGDSFLRVDLSAVEQAWRGSQLPALMTVFHNMDRWDRSNATFRNGLVRYDKRRATARGAVEWIDYGLSVLSSDIVESHVPAGGVSDLADVMCRLSHDDLVAGFEATERFYEVGSPSGLNDLQTYLVSKD